VNTVTYQSLMCIRYYCITIDPSNCQRFQSHTNTFANQNLLHIRKLNIDCTTDSGSNAVNLCLLAAARVPQNQLQQLCWKMNEQAPDTEIQNSDLFHMQSNIRSLTLSPWPDAQHYPSSITSLVQLQELEVYVFSSRLHAPVNAATIRQLVTARGSQVKKLRVVRRDGAHCPRPITNSDWRQLLSSETALDRQHLPLMELTLQHCNSRDPQPLPWETLNSHNIETLRLHKHLDFSMDLHHFAISIPSLLSLTRLELSLWANCMDKAPQQVYHIEKFLLHDTFCSLKHLHVDLPGGSRHISAESISRHILLRTLSINATDENGWLCVFPTSALSEIVRSCTDLRILKCVVPAVQNETFYVSHHILLSPTW
jgi:hypothetical protein